MEVKCQQTLIFAQYQMPHFHGDSRKKKNTLHMVENQVKMQQKKRGDKKTEE